VGQAICRWIATAGAPNAERAGYDGASCNEKGLTIQGVLIKGDPLMMQHGDHADHPANRWPRAGG
jgi:hypothetical protein